MEVVPTHDDLTVEVMVSPMDVDAVTVGMESEVRFSGLPHSQTPMLFGKVIRVGADITVDQQGHSYYIARVQVPPEEMEKIAHITLIPGMPAEVLIKAGERTLFEYLTRPLTDSFFKAFKEV
jgi:multidrug efflux pump subunit AcrA (membrane-fusion protein)